MRVLDQLVVNESITILQNAEPAIAELVNALLTQPSTRHKRSGRINLSALSRYLNKPTKVVEDLLQRARTIIDE
jgi:hypothetical protein